MGVNNLHNLHDKFIKLHEKHQQEASAYACARSMIELAARSSWHSLDDPPEEPCPEDGWRVLVLDHDDLPLVMDGRRFYEHSDTDEEWEFMKRNWCWARIRDVILMPLDRDTENVSRHFVSVPKEPFEGQLESMAIRMDHGLGVPGYYPDHEKRMEAMKRQMRQIYEEATGQGFYTIPNSNTDDDSDNDIDYQQLASQVYQAVGVLLDQTNRFDTEEGQRLLDLCSYLAGNRDQPPKQSILPFGTETRLE